MSFIYPWFLWALLLLIVPIIIHLFYFRRYKTIYFTNVQFLKEVKEQTAARSRLKHLLTLAMRLLALAALVFAFAMPFVPDKNDNVRAGGKDVSIFFDNSFSMSAETEDQRLIERARMRAEEIIAAYDNDDKIQIITADFEGRDQRLLSKEDALSRVREIKTTYASCNLSKVLARQKAALQAGKNNYKDVYLISDFQENSSDLTPEEDTLYKVHLVPLQSIQNKNLTIDSAWFESPVPALNQANVLFVRISNLGDAEIPNVRLTLTLDGQLRPEGTLRIPANGSIIDTINVTINNTGWHAAKINITDFPIEFDNDYFFSFNVAEKVEIMEINEGSPNSYLAAAFAQNPYFVLTPKPLGQLDYSQLGKYNMLILNELKSIPSGLVSELTTFVKNGGNVLVFPSPDAKLADYNALSNALAANEWGALTAQNKEVSVVNFDDFVFNDVFEIRKENLKLPTTSQNFRMLRKASEETLLRYRDGTPFVSKHANERGHLYLCASPLGLGFSNFVQNGEIFVPMLYRMAISSAQARRIAYTIGKDNAVETINRSSVSEIVYKMSGDMGEFIPEQRAIGARVVLGINNQIQQAGLYKLYYTAGEILDQYAFNYDRRESDMRFLNPDKLAELTKNSMTIIEGSTARDFTTLISSQNKGTQLWKWCLIFSLIFLLIETLVLRLIKG
jgi:hypothetical protein